MRKIFLFLFAAVLSIGTAMAETYTVECEGVTVSTQGTDPYQSIVLTGSWDPDGPENEPADPLENDNKAVTVYLYQGGGTQGFGEYAAAEWGPVVIGAVTVNEGGSVGQYTDNGDGSFTFEGTVTKGDDTYNLHLTGSTESGSGDGEGENYVEKEGQYAEMTIGKGMMDEYVTWSAIYFSEDWSIELYSDGPYAGFDELMTVYGYYTPAEGDGFDITGTGTLYFDDVTNKLLFQTDELVSYDGSTKLYINLYASYLTLMASNTFEPSDSWAGATYTNLYLSDPDWAWWLDLHVENYTGAGDYFVSDELCTLNDEISVSGSVSVFSEDGLHTVEASLETTDAAMTIGVLFFEVKPAVYNITANATVAVGEYPLEFTCTWTDTETSEDHSVKVEVMDVVFDSPVAANIVWDGGIPMGGDYAEGTVTMTKSGNNVTVEGQFVADGTSATYNVTLTGTLPAGVRETITLNDGEDYTALLEKYAGQAVNVVVGRSLGTDGLYTLTVPFDMKAEDLGKAYQISSVIANTEGTEIQVMCTKATTIMAGQPYIIEAKKGFSGSFGVENVTIQNVTGSSVVAKSADGKITVTMHGVINTTGATTGGSLWWIGTDEYEFEEGGNPKNAGKLYDEDVVMLGLRAYFSITTPSGMPPRVRVVTEENAATGLDNITTGENPVKTIVNGQLIITVDGVKYNVQGQKL